MDTPPPGLYPTAHEPQGRAEALVWRHLGQQLPTGWHVWHHVKVGRGLEQAEIDFVVAVPDRGVVLVEVKGGTMGRRDGRWHQNGHPLAEQPDEQVERARKAFLRDLRRLVRYTPEVAIALCFPETSSPSSRDVGGLPILFQEDVAWFEHGGKPRLAQAFSGAGHRPDERYLAALHTMWGPDWWPLRPLTRSPDRAEVAWRQLTSEQAVLLSCLDRSRRMMVEGPPGSGKTVVLQALAHRLQQAGRRTLVLTFTRALATELRRVGLRSVFPIRDFARDEARRRGLVCADDAEVLTWKTPSWETMLRAVIDALSEASEPIWDLVLVDEAQDLGDLDWALVDVLVTAGAALWLFGDENQRALRHAQNAEIPERLREAGVFRLRAGLRSPPDLLDLATRVLHDDVPPTEAVGQQGGDEALAFVRLDEASDAATTDALERVVRGLLAQEGVRLDDIMVISLGSAQRSRLASWSTLAGHPSRPADDSGVEPSLVADTVMRLKGLERPHVIVVDTDLGASDPRAWRRAMYLAMTRASASCVIVTTLAALRSTVLTERMRANGG